MEYGDNLMNKISNEIKLDLWKEMVRIRAYEEGIVARYVENKMRCPTHLSIGQEAVPAALSPLLRIEDMALSTHRAHAHYLAKGGSGPRMIAEIYGKSTGCAAGKGGSMHLIDRSVGFKGSTAIVGNTIPVGVGIGLALKMNGGKNISVIFLGDGATETGAFYEAIGFAILKKLPVLFVCENNLYSVYSHITARQPKNRQIHKAVEGLGIRSLICDGNDVESCYSLLKDEIEHVRNTTLPCFIEFPTYRWREHCGINFDNHIGYRTEQEFLEWKNRDPILIQEKRLLADGILTLDLINELKTKIANEVTEAFDFAERSPFPGEQDGYEHIFAAGSVK